MVKFGLGFLYSKNSVKNDKFGISVNMVGKKFKWLLKIRNVLLMIIVWLWNN